jgi:uncharacterized GH25 family protein
VTRSTRVIVAALALLSGGAPAAAHDFWIEPSNFSPPIHAAVKVHLRVGHAFSGEPVVRNPARIRQFALIGTEGEQPVSGLDGEDPAGIVRFAAPGTFLLAYRSTDAMNELPAARFEAYLREEGLEAIMATRRARGESDRPGRELYSRACKAIIRVGDTPGSGGGAGFDRVIGHTLEIVPETDPARASASGTMTLRVLFEGQPLEGALVGAAARGRHGPERTQRTDSAGRAGFTLPTGTAWLFTVVHMIEVPPEERAARSADWRSIWASLTMEVGSMPEPP